MSSSQQLALIDLQDLGLNIPIYGTSAKPFVKCKDLIIHVLGHKKSRDANWYKEITDKQRQLYIFSQGGESPSFNEQGIYWALMKSNKPIAEEFQKRVTLLLTQLREQTQLRLQQSEENAKQVSFQLEEEKKQVAELKQEIEELKQPKLTSIYILKHNGRILYVGKDKSKAQNRPQQHLTERRKIAQNNQLIDIFLATIPENEIKIEIQPCNDQEADQLEKDMIEDLQPEYNQSMNNRTYKCPYCNPAYPYKSRGPYEKHVASCIHNNTHI